MRAFVLKSVVAGAVLLIASAPLRATPEKPEIEQGFLLLYELRFEEARRQFLDWQKDHPQDPLGPASEAASYLFEEFHRQGVLTSEFFLDDDRLLGGIEGKPDPEFRKRFLDANKRAQSLARKLLQKDEKDADALFVLTITTGMHSNYAGIIEKENLKSLRLVRRAEDFARELLAVRPDAYDAYLSLGATNYIIGSLPAYKRFFLWFGGIGGDREEGMRQLGITAKQGHYLRPYAKIFLALAALREKQSEVARTQLGELVKEFPGNTLFRHELDLLDNDEQASHQP